MIGYIISGIASFMYLEGCANERGLNSFPPNGQFQQCNGIETTTGSGKYNEVIKNIEQDVQNAEDNVKADWDNFKKFLESL